MRHNQSTKQDTITRGLREAKERGAIHRVAQRARRIQVLRENPDLTLTVLGERLSCPPKTLAELARAEGIPRAAWRGGKL